MLDNARQARYDLVWERLHSREQETVSRQQFLRCYQPTSANFTDVNITGVYEDELQVFGPAMAVVSELPGGIGLLGAALPSQYT